MNKSERDTNEDVREIEQHGEAESNDKEGGDSERNSS